MHLYFNHGLHIDSGSSPSRLIVHISPGEEAGVFIKGDEPVAPSDPDGTNYEITPHSPIPVDPEPGNPNEPLIEALLLCYQDVGDWDRAQELLLRAARREADQGLPWPVNFQSVIRDRVAEARAAWERGVRPQCEPLTSWRYLIRSGCGYIVELSLRYDPTDISITEDEGGFPDAMTVPQAPERRWTLSLDFQQVPNCTYVAGESIAPVLTMTPGIPSTLISLPDYDPELPEPPEPAYRPSAWERIR